VGAACSRDLFNSRLQAAPTGVFLGYFSLPDKRILFFNMTELRFNCSALKNKKTGVPNHKSKKNAPHKKLIRRNFDIAVSFKYN